MIPNVRKLKPIGWEFFDTHPNSEWWERQKSVSKIPFLGSWYADYMRNKSTDERNTRMLALYGMSPANATYPWLTGTNNAGASVSRGLTMVSRNVSSLYKSGTRKNRKRY